MLIQLDFYRKQKRELEARGETTKLSHIHQVIKRLEAEIGTYDGKGLDYDDGCTELPEHIFNAVKKNNMKKVMKWLGSPVDKNKLNARDSDHLNCTLAHSAVGFDNSGLLSILLQYGADVNVLDARGCSPLVLAHQRMVNDTGGFELAKILLEWGAEISMPHSHVQAEYGLKDEFIRVVKKHGNTKLANLISSEFGGRRCEVINLPNHPQLNGKTCVVEKYIAKKDKYKIIFEGSGNAALVGPNNLKRRDRTPLDCGYYERASSWRAVFTRSSLVVTISQFSNSS